MLSWCNSLISRRAPPLLSSLPLLHAMKRARFQEPTDYTSRTNPPPPRTLPPFLFHSHLHVQHRVIHTVTHGHSPTEPLKHPHPLKHPLKHPHPHPKPSQPNHRQFHTQSHPISSSSSSSSYKHKQQHSQSRKKQSHHTATHSSHPRYQQQQHHKRHAHTIAKSQTSPITSTITSTSRLTSTITSTSTSSLDAAVAHAYAQHTESITSPDIPSLPNAIILPSALPCLPILYMTPERIDPIINNIPSFISDAVTVLQHPLTVFHGRLIVCDHPSQVDAAMKFMENEKIVGLDTESKPHLPRKAPIALLQIASAHVAVVMRIHMWKRGVAPASLKRLLESESIIKVGQSPFTEISTLNEQLGVTCRGIADCEYLGRQLGAFPTNLRALCGIFLGRIISKAQQMTNWERPQLTQAQLIYAATDAWVSREVTMTMLKHHRMRYGLSEEMSILDQLRHTGALINSFLPDPLTYGCSLDGRCGLPMHLSKTTNACVMLDEWIIQQSIPVELWPYYVLRVKRPEGVIISLHLPHLNNIMITHTSPMTNAQAQSYLALKALHQFHATSFHATSLHHKTSIPSQQLTTITNKWEEGDRPIWTVIPVDEKLNKLHGLGIVGSPYHATHQCQLVLFNSKPSLRHVLITDRGYHTRKQAREWTAQQALIWIHQQPNLTPKRGIKRKNNVESANHKHQQREEENAAAVTPSHIVAKRQRHENILVSPL